MRKILKQSMGTDQIEKVNVDELKEKIDGSSNLLNKLKYRGRKANQVNDKKKITIDKGAKLKFEHHQADAVDDKELNQDFGFRCLHYSISEAAEQLSIAILKK
jgi:hypothetical protein